MCITSSGGGLPKFDSFTSVYKKIFLKLAAQSKLIYGGLRRYLGEILHKLASERDCAIEERHLMPDHVHILISISTKCSVSKVIGFVKGDCTSLFWL